MKLGEKCGRVGRENQWRGGNWRRISLKKYIARMYEILKQEK